MVKRTLIALIASLTLTAASLGFLPSPASANHFGYDETVSRADLHQGHADVLRLYWAFFDRQPEYYGADYWIRSYDSCEWSSTRIADFFSVSPEFVATYGSPTDDEFVDLIYANVFDRAPDAAGRAFWLGRLAGGQTRGSVVADLAFSPEFRTAHPLPSDGRANTGCESTDDRAYDPVSALVDFSAAWDAQDFVAMEAVATNSVILTAHDWWQAPNTGVVSAITAAEAHTILADCGHPGSLETSCQVSVGVPGGGPERPLFDLVMLHSDDGNFVVIYLAYIGDGTS